MGVKIAIGSTVYTLVAVGVSWWLWDFLSEGESLSSALRNLVLIWGTFLAILLALWRSWVADKQVKVSQDQVEVAQVALLSARYQRAVEMLGHEGEAIRTGGIESLRDIALEHDEYRPEVENLIGSYYMTSTSMGLTESRALDEAILRIAAPDSAIRKRVEASRSAYTG